MRLLLSITILILGIEAHALDFSHVACRIPNQEHSPFQGEWAVAGSEIVLLGTSKSGNTGIYFTMSRYQEGDEITIAVDGKINSGGAETFSSIVKERIKVGSSEKQFSREVRIEVEGVPTSIVCKTIPLVD